MFQKRAPVFLYSVSPVHMGAGTQLGAVDNPIQRERHTDHPMMVGSGIKGAVRHLCGERGRDAALEEVFGPDAGNSELHAGAVSFADAQLVLFPVRSLRNAFAFATSPVALHRLARLLELGGVDFPALDLPELGEGECVVASDKLLSDGDLVLESYALKPRPEGAEPLKAIANWLAEHAVGARSGFQKKIRADLVLLQEDVFTHFVRHATVVEPHVRINDETGTADDGGLFYTENLPPECLLVTMVMASPGRRPKDHGGGAMSADAVLGYVRERMEAGGGLVQVGGDATTGRGLVLVRFTGGAGEG